MRAVQRSEHSPLEKSTQEIMTRIRGTARSSCGQTAAMLPATVTVIAYLAGILYERTVSSNLFVSNAQYYLEATSYSAYLPVFLRMQAIALLHLTIVLFLGLHLLGSMLSLLFCAVHGLLFGLCISGIAAHGGKLLVWFWLINGAFIICHAINVLWLCAMAKCSGNHLLTKVLNRKRPQGDGHPPYRLKYLMVRYVFALLLSLLYSAAGALIAILFAGVLL